MPAPAAARWHEGTLGELLEAVPDATILARFDGRIALANAAAEALFGYDREELVGQPVELLVPENRRAYHTRHRAAYAAELTTRPMGIGLELSGRHKSGRTFPVEISLSYVDTEDGRYVAAAVRDVSDRKRVEQALRQKNEELEQALSAKDRFLASMSHELRTPLNAILGYTGALLMELPGPLNDEQQGQLSTINEAADRLLALIDDLLDLATIESGKVELVMEPVDCRSLLEEIAGDVVPRAEAKGLGVQVELCGWAVLARGERTSLRRALAELADNAVKFTETGHVRLALGERADGDRRTVVFEVSDTGTGIDPADQARIFRPLGTAGDPRSRPFGRGLGLHVARRRLELIGANLHCRSAPGQGTTFTVELEGC